MRQKTQQEETPVEGFVSFLNHFRGLDLPALTMLDLKGNPSKTLTYKQLWDQSGILAAHLLKNNLKPKDRIVFVYPINAVLEYLTGFVACLRIGVTPVRY